MFLFRPFFQPLDCPRLLGVWVGVPICISNEIIDKATL
ncbi:hypothetical protein GM3709_133 [Geminocystis sp. NIES-3709]|nr:hypothetical protein GM3709_133 [Geminocystis sp. NIES-3709]